MVWGGLTGKCFHDESCHAQVYGAEGEECCLEEGRYSRQVGRQGGPGCPGLRGASAWVMAFSGWCQSRRKRLSNEEVSQRPPPMAWTSP